MISVKFLSTRPRGQSLSATFIRLHLSKPCCYKQQIKTPMPSHQQCYYNTISIRRIQSRSVLSSISVPSATACTDIMRFDETSVFHKQSGSSHVMMMIATGLTALFVATTSTSCFNSPNITICDNSTIVENATTNGSANIVLTPSVVAKEDFEHLQELNDIEQMPIYTLEQLAENNGEDGKPIWMSYGGIVYDVTKFIQNHPGGSEKIMMAAGSHIEPFWYLYRQHYSSDLPMRLMEHMAVGRLSDTDQDSINEQLELLEQNDPYSKEPLRHKSLLIHGDTPMNAEIPSNLLLENYITPTSLFYIRHHHPVPFLNEKEINNFRLHVDLSSFGGPKDYHFTLDELKQMEKTSVTVTLQCSGNRRSGFNFYQRTSGTPWGQGAISTATFTGVRLKDLLAKAGLNDPIKIQEQDGIEHVRFHAIDGMSASIGIEKAMNPYGDCIIAYDMNGEPLSREHGAPLRVIVPGYAAIRNVKWTEKIELSKEEAEGPWQRGLNYKILPPSVVDANEVDLSKMPSINEASLFSGITKIEPITSGTNVHAGDIVVVKVSGWAWAGGGRNIVRVDVTGNVSGGNWSTAELLEGSKQPYGRAWAWTFWECELPVKIQEDGTIHIASKAIDMAFNVQPEKCDHMWNVRGLCNNSWYRAHIKVV